MRRLARILVAAVVVLGFALYVRANRIDPSTVAPEEYHRTATEFDGGTFGNVPGVKTVEVKPLRDDPLYYVRYYLGLAMRRRVEDQAYYDAEKDTIFVVGDGACVEATLPRWMRPTLKHTIRHEYGHAMLADWLETCQPMRAGGEKFLAYTDTSDPSPNACPPRLSDVIEEYSNLPQDVYGQAYYMQTFYEYMAESYARFVGGAYVPPATKGFLREVAESAASTE